MVSPTLAGSCGSLSQREPRLPSRRLAQAASRRSSRSCGQARTSPSGVQRPQMGRSLPLSSSGHRLGRTAGRHTFITSGRVWIGGVCPQRSPSRKTYEPHRKEKLYLTITPVHTNENSLHNSSRSRSPPCFHRFSLALTAEQAEHVLATGILLRSWFGDGRSVLVKNSLETAVEVFVAARQEDPARVVPSILSGQ